MNKCTRKGFIRTPDLMTLTVKMMRQAHHTMRPAYFGAQPLELIDSAAYCEKFIQYGYKYPSFTVLDDGKQYLCFYSSDLAT